jgi:arylsulfatase A-like enzyme
MKKIKFLIIPLCLSIFFLFLECLQADQSQATAGDRPNVIIITIDTLRADHVGCYGYYRDTTPFIDKFSQNAIVFENAVAQGPDTISSMPSFIISKYPFHNLTVSFFPSSASLICILNQNYPTLARLLKGIGYGSCFISDNPQMFQIKYLKRGFDNFVETPSNTPAIVTDKAIRWVRNHKDSPFFIWIHYLGAHAPYEPNLAPSLTIPLKGKDKIVPLASGDFDRLGVISRQAAEAGHNNLNYYINSYDGKVRLTDEQVGIFLKEVNKLGLDKNSIIVITADHGEEFGEHGLYCGHGMFLYNTLLHVPLIMKIPGFDSQRKIISQTVGLIDVIPTIAGVLKISGQKFDGNSLLSSFNGHAESKDIFSGDAMKTSVVSGQWKLIHNVKFSALRNTASLHKAPPAFIKEYELYNLNEDVFERKNIYGKDEKISDALRQQLLNFEAQRESAIQNELLPLFREKSDESLPGENETQKIKALKSLGYLQ